MVKADWPVIEDLTSKGSTRLMRKCLLSKNIPEVYLVSK